MAEYLGFGGAQCTLASVQYGMYAKYDYTM